jgi:phosphoribosyl 1,2-cyclic phosphodiesterase
VKVTFWGCRGSIASAGPRTIRYGGNTSCVQVSADDGATLILDAGTGVRPLGATLDGGPTRVDILLSHLHLDHIQGLGFFRPFFADDGDVHLWGPPSATADLRRRLTRYLSPPLFPVRLRDLTSRVEFHDAAGDSWQIGPFRVRSEGILHPGQTVGYRIEHDRRSMAYLPDHEPALGGSDDPRWTSGFALAEGTDLLVHDAQYTSAEYAERVGWGHSSVSQAVSFANRAGVKHLVLFHHDPDHDDAFIDRLVAEAREMSATTKVSAAREGDTLPI